MDKSLQALCYAVKKTISQLKPQVNELSFLLLIGRDKQGKTTLLHQSHYDRVNVDAGLGADVYFNQHGIIVMLNESWLLQQPHLLQYTLKQLNSSHNALKISGIMLCVDVNDILISEPLEFAQHSKAHTQLLARFGSSLGYRVDTALMFTKLDALAGFCEFFQNDHASDLQKPLGFSIDWISREGKWLNNYKEQFDRFIEVLSQDVILKMHPARSTIKRSLIREFPLQLASLNGAIQALIKTISPKLFSLRELYFSSGEQGGISKDRINKKIQQEYALTVQDSFPQSINHRAYFIEGALLAFQQQTKHAPERVAVSHKWLTGMLLGSLSVAVVWLGAQHLRSTQQLEESQKELLTYQSLSNQHQGDPTYALYHLTKARENLNKLSSHSFYSSTLGQLKIKLNLFTEQQLQGSFLPTVLSEIEQTIIDTRQSQVERYNALKIYVMLGDPTKLSPSEVMDWFHQKDQALPLEKQANKQALLKQILQQPFQAAPINRQIVSDVRNYLNALPPNYLYYILAKNQFSKEMQPFNIDGFEFATHELPIYYTKAGFEETTAKLPAISAQLQTDNWVLARQDLSQLPVLLQQAYCNEYVLWWQNFMRKSGPLHAKDYQQAQHLTNVLHQGDSFNKLALLIQKETSPLSLQTNQQTMALFNQEIASKFTDINLMSQSAVINLSTNLTELEKFLSTLSAVNDHGKTAFTLTKARFENDNIYNPLSAMYASARQLPEPIATWTKQVADDTWFVLINDSKNYINQQWQQTVFNDYKYTIAHRYPLDAGESQEVALRDFDRFFSTNGVLNSFINDYLKPFLDTSQAQWQAKELNNYMLPISSETMNELIRANVITTMFFAENSNASSIDFSLQKLTLDPIVGSLDLMIGNTKLHDTQDSETLTNFHWPQGNNVKLTLNSIEGKHYELEETGPWAFFKMLQKVNVLADEQNNASLQILFEVNGNSGRYVLKTQNQINPFIPGILNGFNLNESIV